MLAKKQAEDLRVGAHIADRVTGVEKTVLLVYYVGGITFMELDGLWFLSFRPLFPDTIVCCTTKNVNDGMLLWPLSC